MASQQPQMNNNPKVDVVSLDLEKKRKKMKISFFWQSPIESIFFTKIFNLNFDVFFFGFTIFIENEKFFDN